MNRPSRLLLPALLGLVICSIALGDSLPHRRAGLWESTMNVAAQNGREVKTQQCVDDKTDEAMQRQVIEGNSAFKCERTEFKLITGGYESSSVCKTGMGTITSHMRMVGDMQSAYRVESNSHREPAMYGPADTHTVINARWLGACPADLKPGDMRINGMVMHLGQGMGGMGGMGGKPGAGGMPGAVGSMTPAERMEYMKKLMEARQQQQ